jgi:hypothetical protein
LKQTALSRVLGHRLAFGRLFEVLHLPFGLAKVGTVEDGTLLQVERKRRLRRIRVEPTAVVLEVILENTPIEWFRSRY